ncbi:MAG: AAA family ATPase [Firmicutes bacterium]|nr:AAA family ATPase [Bacillota bacterium]
MENTKNKENTIEKVENNELDANVIKSETIESEKITTPYDYATPAYDYSNIELEPASATETPTGQAYSEQQAEKTKQPVSFWSKIKQFDKYLQKSNKAKKIMELAIAGIFFLFAIIFLFSPLFEFWWHPVTRFSFIMAESDFLDHILSRMPIASFWVSMIFHTIFAIILIFCMLIVVFAFVNKKKNRISTVVGVIMSITTIFMLFSVLIGMNFIAIFSQTETRQAESAGSGFVIFAIILLVIKLVLNLRYKPPTHGKEIEQSNQSISMVFVLFGLNVLALFVPLYIFPGTPYRLNGWGILTGANDVLSILPTANANNTIIGLLLITTTIAFIASVILYLLNKKIFIQLNKITILLGVTSLLIYVLIGVNYLVLFNDTQAFTHIAPSSWDTYAYIPILLFVMYLLGVFLTKFLSSKAKTEVVYMSGSSDSDTTNNEKGKKKNKAINYSTSEATVMPVVISGSGGGSGTIQAIETIQSDTLHSDPIPAFSQLDKKEEEFEIIYTSKLPLIPSQLTLYNICTFIQEYARCSKDALSYSMREIKTFIAGLSFSRFSILQGLSGTGKTSLPKIVMSALSGNCEMIPVESSWRDKNELLGYYNEFNKKFTPKAFTEGLYKASLNQDTPTFIVLDEMNLSRVEYYFSDFLSILEETDESKRKLKLFDVQLFPIEEEKDNYLSLIDGHTIAIPPNVWFVGTANRDESTFEISDKVYDRANTLNFDKRAPKSAPSNNEMPKIFVPYAKIQQLFKACASMRFDAESNPIVQKVEKLLYPYKILLGNRVIKQIESFVKIYVSCSGDKRTPTQTSAFVNEALDCILLSKLVRKLEFRQVYNIDDLITAFRPLNLPLCQSFLESMVAI